ncbi:MAG: PcfB family protein [Lachnospiraceae bacterium]|nr:PcfB family protein [Lachnospiraceae bacterium]
MSTGTNEVNTINQTVARVVLGSSVFLVKCSSNIVKNFFAAVAHSEKTSGKERLSKLLRSGEPLEIYTLSEDKFKLFKEHADRYGIVFSVVKRDSKDKKDNTYDVMVKKSDAGKLSRVFDKIGYATTKPGASVETVSSEDNRNKEPDGVTMTTEESRNLMDIMLSPDERGMNQNPDMTAEREPLYADTSIEKRSSVNEKMDNYRNLKNRQEDESSHSNMVNTMLSGYEDEKNKINGIDMPDESDILMGGNVSDGKESGL